MCGALGYTKIQVVIKSVNNRRASNFMHLKTIIKKNNKIYIEHYVIVDAIDGSNTYYEELTIKNCIKYFPEIISFLKNVMMK